MTSVSRKRWMMAGVAASVLLGLGGWLYYEASQPQSFCQAIHAGASLDELTQYLKENDPSALANEDAIGSFEHTTKRPYACTFQVADGRVVSAEALK